jgi:hypothetical protein
MIRQRFAAHMKEGASDAPESSKATSSQRALDIAKSAGKLALKAVKELSDAFPPLQCVANALDFVIENVEACNCYPAFFLWLTAELAACWGKS